MRRSYTIRSDSLDDPNVPITGSTLREYGQGVSNDAGVAVTTKTALGYAPLYQAVSMISGDVAKLPLGVYQRTDKGRQLISSHQVHKRINLYGMTNPETPAWKFWRRIMTSALLWGNGYAYIDRDGAGRVLGLYNLLPDRTTPMRKDGQLWYVTEVGKQLEAIPAQDIYHIEGLSLDGMSGANTIKLFREDFGIALARRRFTAKFFKNNMSAGGILSAPLAAKPSDMRKIRKEVNAKYSGVEDAFKTVVLKDGYKWFSTQIDPQKAQLQEMDEQQARNVARMFNLNPSRLGVLGSTSYNSQEMARQDYMDGALSHWLIGNKSETNCKLLSEDERENQSLYIDYNINALLWTDAKTRSDIATAGILIGRWSPNETRAWENADSYEGGDTYYRPLNTEAVGTKSQDSRQAMQALLTSTLKRAGNRLGIKAERKGVDGMEDERAAVAEILEPAFAVCVADPKPIVDQWMDSVLAQYRSGTVLQTAIDAVNTTIIERLLNHD